MSTLADIQKAAESPVTLATDDDTPTGHFTATTRILGLATTYLLAGVEGDPQAEIVGRIEWPVNYTDLPTIAAGSGLKGGRTVFRVVDTASAFAGMVEQASQR